MSRSVLVAALAGWLPLVVAAQPLAAGGTSVELPAEPLRARNLHPVVRLIGLPQPMGLRFPAGARELSVTLDHANHFTVAARGERELLLDGSTTVATVGWRAGTGARWEWGIEVPLVHHGGGFTDGFIDGFHDLFGFPDGDRDTRPRDALAYRVTDRGRNVLDVSDEQHGLGDLRAWAGYRVLQRPGQEVVVRAAVKAPTGDPDDLTGSGGTDLSVWLELVEGRWLQRLRTTVTLAAGLTAPAELDLPAQSTRNLVYSGHLGLHYAATRRLTLQAQLDGHSEVLAAGVPRLAQAALLGTLGGSLRLSGGARLDLAVVEDLTPDRAPDVVFQIRLVNRFR